MSLFAPIPELTISDIPVPIREADVRLSSRTIAAAWFEVRAQDLSIWNHVLLGTDASLYQFPFFNEPYRQLGLRPRYVAWGTQDRPLAYACILTVGFGPAKIGLVFRGPNSLLPGTPLTQTATSDLLDWARAQGYIFIRFTHSDPQVLRQLANAGHAENFDAFPYFLDYPILSPDYVIEQHDREDDTLATFDREARRKIRRAAEAGYEFRSSDSPAVLAKAWPLFQECARRKRFRLERPLSVYTQMMRLAGSHDCMRLYSVHKDGKMVGASLVLRDHTTAHCQLAAFDREHRESSAFLHWHAMRDMYRLGASRYNLGPGPRSLARFKRQFCERPVSYPSALTLVLNDDWFRVWKMIFPLAKALRPILRKIVSRIKR